MGAIAFTRNYTDHSNDTGYQFEFHCDKCGNGYRSTFHANALGVGSKLAKGLGSLFGGPMFAAGQAGEYMKDGLRGGAWDGAFKAAIEEIKPKFHQCPRCAGWLCPEVCWNNSRGLCRNCAPDLEQEAASMQAKIQVDQAQDALRKVNQIQGFDPSANHAIGAAAGGTGAMTCAACHTPLQQGSKFCSGCGAPAAQAMPKVFCTNCGSQFPPGGKFCAGCGTPAG